MTAVDCGHRCCDERTNPFHDHFLSADDCPDCHSDPLVESVDDECPTCGAYVLNPALHKDWHGRLTDRLDAINEKAGRYVPPPTYASGTYRGQP